MPNVTRIIHKLKTANTLLANKQFISAEQRKVARRAKQQAMKQLANMIGPNNAKQLSLYAR